MASLTKKNIKILVKMIKSSMKDLQKDMEHLKKKFPSSFTDEFDLDDPVRVRFSKLREKHHHLFVQLNYLKLQMCSLATKRVGIDDRRLQAFAESKGYPTFPVYVENLKKIIGDYNYLKQDRGGRDWYMPKENEDFGGFTVADFRNVEDIISTARKM